MTPTDTTRVTDALDMRAIRKGLQNTDYDVDENASRSVFNNWIADLDGERDDFIEQLKPSAKVAKLQPWSTKLSGITETESDDIAVNADSLTVRGAHYYDSFFHYTNHTTWVFGIQWLSGTLKQIHENATSADEAQEILRSHCKDLSEPMYQMAAEEIPSPVIGNVDGSESPRLFHFENKDHLYVEYWTEGSEQDTFDVNTGDYKVAQTLQRTCFRIHLDSGLVEITGDASRGPNKDALKAFLERLGGNPVIGDVNIGTEGIQKAKENLAFIVSLDEFDGEDAKIRFSKNDNGDVEADPYHSDTESERERVRLNMQLLYGRTQNGWELIYRKEVGQQYSDSEEVEVGQLIKDLKRSGPFKQILPLTVGLNREKSSIRFYPEEISPPTRRTIFHLFADELEWR
ncbi:MAG: hypothetical protein U9O06_00685 [Euryarchaeota archaeon]|nr:hypothetical protein [Euryarchaeota archaeon]